MFRRTRISPRRPPSFSWILSASASCAWVSDVLLSSRSPSLWVPDILLRASFDERSGWGRGDEGGVFGARLARERSAARGRRNLVRSAARRIALARVRSDYVIMLVNRDCGRRALLLVDRFVPDREGA